jgi:cyclohexadieny/prephenate dehydrogenase
MGKAMFDKVALIGLGLIGSSLAHAMRAKRLAGHVAGHARSQATRDKAVALGLVDTIHETAGEAAEGADLVILCAPVGANAALAAEIGPRLGPGAIVTDVGSVKTSVIKHVAPHLPKGVHLVPGHPVAGTEQSGPEAGFAELFEGRWCILTPPPETSRQATDKLAAFWRACGSDVEIMTAEHHDMVLAITSHIPHLIAYNIVGTADHLEEVTESEVIKFSAGGFRDFTRIAASDPTMWRDVFLHNRDAVLEMLGRFSEDLSALQRAIRFGDGDALFDLFTHTRAVRRSIVEAGQETDVADFGRRVPTSATEAGEAGENRTGKAGG